MRRLLLVLVALFSSAACGESGQRGWRLLDVPARANDFRVLRCLYLGRGVGYGFCYKNRCIEEAREL